MARTYKALDNWLTSVGISLLVLSVMLVPAHRILANADGGSGPIYCAPVPR